MKKIYLMRHSILERRNLPTEQLPLSEEGKKLILSKKDQFHNIAHCFCSPYKRALETAKLMTDHVEVVNELHERIIGDASEDFWCKQYSDHNFRNKGGESLNEVKVRMKATIDSILEKMNEGESVLVVSHATEMCSYLLNYCEIEVSDAKTKARKITWNQHVILNGTINPTDYFIIEFEKDEVQDIRLGVSHVK